MSVLSRNELLHKYEKEIREIMSKRAGVHGAVSGALPVCRNPWGGGVHDVGIPAPVSRISPEAVAGYRQGARRRCGVG